MKELLLLVVAVMSLTFATASTAWSQVSMQSDYKVKTKGDRAVVTDKSKPARRALEEQYAKIAEANKNKDLAAEMALRTPDFSAQFPNGEIRNSEQMAGYSRALFSQIQSPIVVTNTIESLDVHGDRAVAVVHQVFSRMQVKSGQASQDRNRGPTARDLGINAGRLAA